MSKTNANNKAQAENSTKTTKFSMSKSAAIQLYTFLGNVELMSDFLTVAINSIFTVHGDLSDSEKDGFCLCMAAVKANIKYAYTILETAEIKGTDNE